MKFSIITICKNDLDRLKKTYNSVKNQTFFDFEWVVIDGESNDGTIQFLHNIDLKNFKFISEPDRSLYDAMNKGLDISTGKYIVFLNTGDLFMDENTLQIVSDEVDKHKNIAFLYGDTIDYLNDKETYYRKSKHHKTIYKGMFAQHSSIYFASLEKPNQIKFDLEYRLSGDYQRIIKYIELERKGFKIIKVDLPLSRFELGGLNEIQRFKGMKEDFQIRKKDLKLNFFSNSFLYMAHHINTLLKTNFPTLMRKIRY